MEREKVELLLDKLVDITTCPHSIQLCHEPGSRCKESRSPALLVKVPCGAASRGPWGQNKNPKILSLGRF